jgi:DNA-binding NtrC family response regulator
MGRNVLVIDNDCQVRQVVCTALERDDFVAVGVASYPEAVEQLCWSPADLAICDGFTAEGLSGVSLLHRLFPPLRYVVLSGGVTQKFDVPISAAHYLSILPKPHSLEALQQAVHQALTREANVCLQAILERGRLGFLMVVLRQSPG